MFSGDTLSAVVGKLGSYMRQHASLPRPLSASLFLKVCVPSHWPCIVKYLGIITMYGTLRKQRVSIQGERACDMLLVCVAKAMAMRLFYSARTACSMLLHATCLELAEVLTSFFHCFG